MLNEAPPVTQALRQPSGGRRRSAPAAGVLVVVMAACAGIVTLACGGDSPAGPGTLRFGQIGEVRLLVEQPLRLGEGRLTQEVKWLSRGSYVFTEEISYQGRVGDRTVRRSEGNPEVIAGSYAQWIAQVNDVPSLRLFVDGLDPTLDPECGEARSRVTLTIMDEPLDQSVSWTRCADGSLGFLTPRNAGPDPAASRVVSAATLLRDNTLGGSFLSTYLGSVPFATLDRGEDSRADLPGGRTITTQPEWENFWENHTGGGSSRPEVDFEEEVVIVAAVGVRQEAGDSVEIRRILPVDGGTLVEVFERVPGDFCSPAARSHVPFHIVVSPRVPAPIGFSDVRVERVPCGR